MKLKYIGDVPTRVRCVHGEEKIDVEKGDVFEIEAKMAKNLLGTYKGVFVEPGNEPKSEKAEKKAKK